MSSPLPMKSNCLGRTLQGLAVCAAWAALFASAMAAQSPRVDLDKSTFSDSAATLEFSVAPGDGQNLAVTVFYGKERGGASDDSWPQNTGAVKPDETKNPGEYTVQLAGLDADTIYYYRVKAVSTVGTDWSELAEFRTAKPALPWYLGVLYLLLVAVMLVLPFVAGSWLSRLWRMPDYGWKLGVIFFTLLWSIYFVSTRELSLGIDLSGGVVLVYELEDKPEVAAEGEEEDTRLRATREEEAKITLDQLVGAISLRVDPGGTRNVDIREYGRNQIEVLIPRANPEEVRRIREKISRAGTLEFRILADRRDSKHKEAIALGVASTEDTIRDTEGEEIAWWVPVRPGEEKGLAEDANLVTRTANFRGNQVLKVLVVNDEYDVEGGNLSHCGAGVDDRLRPCVNFSFNRRGSALFGRLTTANQPDRVQQDNVRRLGVILDSELYSAPVIKSPIFGQGIIEGDFSEEEVQDLVDVLNAGSLPAKLKPNPVSEQESGPTLGRDMIRRGTIAIGLSLVAVFLSMTIYYRFAGVVASAAVIMNLVLLLAVMDVVKGFDLTLPGIAGLVLGLGMAVDANVLIFERIREELDRGATLRMAIRNGFDRALSVIIDSNLTGLITAVILYALATSQVKGFAVTLGLSIVFSMFTAVFCSRVVFDIGERRGWIKKLTMMRLIKTTHFNFMGRASLFGVGLSVTLLVIGLVAAGTRGKGLLDIDFTGGESVQLLFKEPQKIDKIRARLQDAKDADDQELFPDVTVTDTTVYGEKPGLRFLMDTSKEVDEKALGKTATEVVEDDLRRIFGDDLATNKMTVVAVAPIGPSVQPKPAEPEPPAKVETPKPAEAATPEPATGPETPDSAKPETPAPANSEQSRNDLPSSSLLASTDPAAVLLAQADPPAPPGEQPTDKDTPPTAESKPIEPPPAESKPAESKPVETQPTAPPPAESKPADPQPVELPAAQPSTESVAAPSRFEGGAQVDLRFDLPLDHETVRDLLVGQLAKAKVGDVPFELTNDRYEPGDTDDYRDWTLRIKLTEEQLRADVLKPLTDRLATTPHFPASSSIGGKVAGDMQSKALIALVLSLVCVVLYLWVRFQHVMYGLAAVVALVHDVLITLGFLAISAYVHPVLDTFKIGLTVMAAFLTIIGYSLNDTIVVFDRIREVKGKSPHLTAETINASINQTLGRTLLTGTTTLFVLIILFYGGGTGLHAFAFTMLVGILTGTYSSIFVASPILYWMTGKTTGTTKKA